MSANGLIDWTLAERIAAALAGRDGARGPFVQSAVDSACAEARGLVLDYVQLRPVGSLPRPELIDRSDWTRIGLETVRELSVEVEERLDRGLELPGPLGRVVRSVAGAAAGAEAGAAVGYGACRVLGQYDVGLLDPDREPRLLFVAANLATAHAELGEDPELFLRWIAIHETTHSVQFASVPWLRPHIAELLRRLIGGAVARLDAGSLRRLAARILRTDPRAAIRALVQGDLPQLLAGADEARTLDELQVVMSVIEGHAEHVMDAAVEPLDPGYGRLRARVEARRARRGGLGEVIARLLGLELKLRQYRLGKAFCDQVAGKAGVEGLNRVWRSPEALPTMAELNRPQRWLARIAAVAPA
jgi:coenzyme F420 biosynthesis associated uncharacterized protein